MTHYSDFGLTSWPVVRMPPRNRRSKAKPIQTSASAHRVHPNGPISGCHDSRANAGPHPIHSLPLEILSQIFNLALHIDFTAVAELHETSRHSERHLQIFNPLVLCAVCSSWRSLGFATPRLWRRVFIHIPPELEKAQDKKQAADLVQWIERACSLPLALHISCDFQEGLPQYATASKNSLLSVVNDYAARWESLYVQHVVTTLQLGPSPTLPLTLFQSETWHRFLWKTIALSFPVDEFPFAELTHFQVHDHYSVSCENIFMKTPKLVQLSISVVSLPVSLGGCMIHHNLVTFSLKMSNGSDRLLNRLSLPSLRDMFIKQVSSEHIEPLLNCFTQSSCSLSKLEVYGLNLSPDDVLNVLAHRSCNSLTSLTILEPCGSQRKRKLVDDDVLRRLALHQDDSLCPHLKFLTIDCATECSLSVLLKLVESRVGCLADLQPPDEPIQYLHLRSIKRLNDVRKLDEIGKGSGMEYARRRYREVASHYYSQYFYSVLFEKQGLQRKQLLINHGGFFFHLD